MSTAAAAKQPALRIGLTGGIASGKSTVAQLFAAHGVPILDADRIAREVVAPGSALRAQLFERFGEQIRDSKGDLDRTALRRLVFADESLRRELEALMHPAIQQRTEQLAASTHGAYQIHVVPLLVENNLSGRYDRILVVDSPEALQLARLRARDGSSAAQARAILAAQASRAARLAIADDVIVNDAAAQALHAQVASLHERYLQLAAARGHISA
jgi:dephospho-CoA kinase